MEKTVVELFAGVGGFRVGLNKITRIGKEGKAIEKGDWKFVWANQYEPSTKTQDAFDCYKKRFGDNEIDNRDISIVDKKKDIPEHSLLVGGFPCQDYSVARGKSGEKGIQGKKGVLFWQIAEILDEKNPPFVLLENVDRLLKSPAAQRGRDFAVMLRTFADKKYNVEWRVINAADYGFPQRRRRVFIYAWKKNTKYNKSIIKNTYNDIITSEGLFAKTFKVKEDNMKVHQYNIAKYKDVVEVSDDFQELFENSGVMIDSVVYTKKLTADSKRKKVTLRNILDEETDKESFYLTKKQESKFKTLRGSKKIPRKKPNGEDYLYSEGSMSPYDDLDLPGRTMLTSEKSVNRSTHIILDPKANKLRFITPVEAERMQCFPSNWTKTEMSFSKRYFMMGNALVTGIIKDLGIQLSNIIENE